MDLATSVQMDIAYILIQKQNLWDESGTLKCCLWLICGVDEEITAKAKIMAVHV